jgi:cytochrome c biogenesis protein ResB
VLTIHNISYTAISIIVLDKFSIAVASIVGMLLATTANANENLEYAKFGCW